MKTVIIMLTTVFLLAAFCGCAEETVITPSGVPTELSTKSEILNTGFSNPFYDDIEGEPKLSDDQVSAILNKVPYDQYENYPDHHNVPLSATLYKDGEEISIDIRDRRLIRMINFYNNAVYYWHHAYSQGCLNMEDIEKAESESNRLVLKYTPRRF